MKLQTARLLNQAACHVGAHVMGITHPALRPDMLEIVQRVSLAQLETASDMIEAYNLEMSTGQNLGFVFVSSHKESLLANLKHWADRQPRHTL